MASYSLLFRPSVEKDLLHLPKSIVSRALDRIEELKTNPFPPQSLKLSGAENLYRLRVGEYRVIYEVNTEAKAVTIHYVRHRREVYRKL